MLDSLLEFLRSSGGWISLPLVVLLLTLLYWYGMSSYALIRDLPYPGPSPWPFMGNLPDIFRYGGFHHMLMAYFKKYGRVHKMYIARRPTLVVTDPEIVKQVFVKEFDKFPNRPRFIEPRPPASSGLFLARDADWRRIRTTLTPTFTALKLKQVVPIIEKATETLKTKIAKLADTGETADAISLFSLYALDVILNAAFGIDFDIQNKPDGNLIKKAKEAFQTPLYIRFFSMFPFWRQLSKFFDVLPTLKFWAAQARIILEQRKAGGGTGRRDLVQLMLEAGEEKVEGVARLSDEEIIAQSITFLLAGHETTGNTLSNTAFFLVNNPDVQNRLIEELDKARAERGDMSLYDFFTRIPYLDQVISEVLRLCSPAFNLLRGCERECTINGVHFPEGVDVNVPTYTLHRDPEIWGENPEKFDPEHFSHEAKEERHPYAYIPFGTGPHQCIGMRFALMEIKIGLLTVLEHFRFERAPETRPTNEQRAVLLMAPKFPIYVRFSRR